MSWQPISSPSTTLVCAVALNPYIDLRVFRRAVDFRAPQVHHISKPTGFQHD
jgi:hypothetical protein